jgi:2-polyprenyl-3-methyl-5-hydroxy-6-metoxy-1,4-benzoquinol methylase
LDYIEKIHDEDWENIKKDDSYFKNEQRFGIIKDIIMKEQPDIVLDVGCGSGYLASLIKKENPHIVIHGFDVSAVALKKAEALDKKYQLDINYQNIPESDKYYDVVVCSEVMEHLLDVGYCLFEMKRVLKESGRLVLTVPNFGFWRFRIDSLFGKVPFIISDKRHFQVFNKEILITKLKEAGLEIVHLTGIRSRLKSLLRVSPSLFTETLIATFKKSG